MGTKVHYTQVGSDEVCGFHHQTESAVQGAANKWKRRYTTAEMGDVRSFACPDCGAKAGEPCVTKKGTPSKVNHTHRFSQAYWAAVEVAEAKYHRGEWAHT